MNLGRIRLNPLALIPAAMFSPLPSYWRLGRLIAICEKAVKNTELPMHSGAKY